MAFTAFFFYPKWTKSGTEATLSWDASGYYMYLPAIFIYNDIKGCNFKDSVLNTYQPTPDFQQAFIHEKSGNYVMKYSAGQAVVMAPFFAVGHFWASKTGQYPADGFSFPYQISIGVGMFLVALLGLFYLRKILNEYYQDKTVATLLVLYVIGTNYLNYAAIDQAMTHNTLFTIYTLLVWNTMLFYKKNKINNSLAIGILCGLATLIRPTEIISLLIPIMWGLSKITAVKNRFVHLKNNFLKIILAALAFTVIVIIQPVYWKYATGDWIVYSYQDQGFSWLSPHVWDYTMSYQCGWLRFCPFMVSAFLGIIIYIKKGTNKLAVLAYSFLAFYLTTAWDVWDYGGTAGRAMVQHYVILAFPIAALIEWVWQKNFLKIISIFLVLITTYLNLWWHYQAHGGEISVSGLTRKYYWATVGRYKSNDNILKLLDNKDSFTEKVEDETTLVNKNFENDTSANVVVFNNSEAVVLNKELQNTEPIIINNSGKIKKWLRASADFYAPWKEWDLWKQTQFIIKYEKNGEEVKTNMIRLFRVLGEKETKRIYIDSKTPKEWDVAKIYFYNAGSDKEIYIDNLNIITFND